MNWGTVDAIEGNLTSNIIFFFGKSLFCGDRE